MKSFIQEMDNQLWEIIEDSLIVVNTDHIDQRRKILSINTKAKNIVTNELDAKEYNRVMTCEATKEAWDKLQVTHEINLSFRKI